MDTIKDTNVFDILTKYDRDSKQRYLTGKLKTIYKALFIAFSAYIILVALLFNRMSPFSKLPLFLGFAMALGFLKFPACKKDALKDNYIPFYDIILIVLSIGCSMFYAITQNDIIFMGGVIGIKEVVVGIIAIVLLFELCRRSTGIPLMVVAFLFLAYAFIVLYKINPDTAIYDLVYNIYYNLNCGIFSKPVTVCCSFIIIFIIFGSLLEKTGIGEFFVDLSNSLVGSTSGGLAKVAVISSAFEGMYSGSSVANTVGSGSITIPLMKKTGYKGEFAAAVEAAASTGGQIMPPIMGAAAFLMAEITGISYSTIVVAAILPAVLYFTGIFIMVHLEAKKLGLKGLPKDTLPKFGKLLIKKGYLLIPVIALVVAMQSYTAAASASFAILFVLSISLIDKDYADNIVSKDKVKIKKSLLSILFAIIPIVVYIVFSYVLQRFAVTRSLTIAICVAVILSFFVKDGAIDNKKLGDGFYQATNSSIGVITACAMAGIISGVIALTGLGSTLITLIVPVAEKSLIVALILTMLCCIVLGMGVPTTANYVIMATITAPILVKAGVPLLAAHMFVFYFGIVADITPPVALAAYAGSAIAKSNPLKTGLTATKLAIGAFIIPYIFALNPAILFIDTTWYEVILIIITSVIGMFGVSIGMQGFCFKKVHPILRIISFIGGILLIYPGIITDSIGFVLVAFVVVFEYIKNKKLITA